MRKLHASHPAIRAILLANKLRQELCSGEYAAQGRDCFQSDKIGEADKKTLPERCDMFAGGEIEYIDPWMPVHGSSRDL